MLASAPNSSDPAKIYKSHSNPTHRSRSWASRSANRQPTDTQPDFQTTHRQQLRRWWEFQTLYNLLSAKSPHDWFQRNMTSAPAQSSSPSNPSTQHLSNQALPNYAHPKSRQGQIKRQREWIYLTHYLAIQGLNPIHIISGEDDGREPDFTLIFYDEGLYYVGVELTTLPRLRDQMGENGLIGKRWYWQSLQAMAKKRADSSDNPQDGSPYSRFRLPVKTLYMPADDFAKRQANIQQNPQRRKDVLPITQTDVDAVLSKKSHKASAYHTRRPLDELWLLVHTDKYQPNGILQSSEQRLTHDSDFDQIHITRYPSHKVVGVSKERHQN